jgi:adenylate cyclase
MLALAGRKNEAIRESTRATELDHAARSPWTGPEYVLNLAQTYMLVGETDKAIDTLERLLKLPHYMTPAWLAVDPTYDSLRKNPRFQKLVAPSKG